MLNIEQGRMNLCAMQIMGPFFPGSFSPDAQWVKSTGPFAPPFTHLLAPLTHLLALYCSLCSRAPCAHLLTLVLMRKRFIQIHKDSTHCAMPPVVLIRNKLEPFSISLFHTGSEKVAEHGGGARRHRGHFVGRQRLGKYI